MRVKPPRRQDREDREEKKSKMGSPPLSSPFYCLYSILFPILAFLASWRLILLLSSAYQPQYQGDNKQRHRAEYRQETEHKPVEKQRPKRLAEPRPEEQRQHDADRQRR